MKPHLLRYLALLLFVLAAPLARSQQFTYINDVVAVSSTAYEASKVLKAAPGTLYSINGYNSRTSAQWIQVFNSATVPADTAVPVITFLVPATSNFSFTFPSPLRFTTGISVCNSSTGPTKTLGSADVFFMGQIK